MALPDRIKARINNIAQRFGPGERTVYKRIVTITGGNQAIGRPGSVSNADTQLSPQPFYVQLKEEVVLTASIKAQPGDYRLTVSADAMTLADLQNKNLQIVLRDSSNNDEVLNLKYFRKSVVQGEIVSFTVYARSVKV